MKLQPKNLQNINLSKLGKKLTKKLPPMAGKVVPPDIFKPGIKDLPIRAGFAPMKKPSIPKKVAVGTAVAAAAIAVATALVNVVKNIKANKVEKEAEVKQQEVNAPKVETPAAETPEVETPEVEDTQE